MDDIAPTLAPSRSHRAPYSQLHGKAAPAADVSLTDKSLTDISGLTTFVHENQNGKFALIDGSKYYDSAGNLKPAAEIEAVIRDSLAKNNISLPASDITDMAKFPQSHGSAFVGSFQDNIYVLSTQGSQDLLGMYTNIREHPELYAKIDMEKIKIDRNAYTSDAGRAFSNFHEVAHVENDKYLHYREHSNQTIKTLSNMHMDDTNGDIYATIKMAQIGDTSFAPEQAKVRLIEAYQTGPGIYQLRRSPDYDVYTRYTNMTHNSYDAVMGTSQLLKDIKSENWANVESMMTKAYKAYDPNLSDDKVAGQARDFIQNLKDKGGINGLNEDQLRKLSATLTSYYAADNENLIAMMAYARSDGTIKGADELLKKMSSDGTGLSSDQRGFLDRQTSTTNDILTPGRITTPTVSPPLTPLHRGATP